MTYAIKTKKGWKPLFPPMSPTPVDKKWWHFPGSASYDAQFIQDGKDIRITGDWYHLRASK